MNENTIEEQLEKIAETILRLHDKLMAMPYSFKENKQQGKRILQCCGDLYRAYVALKKND